MPERLPTPSDDARGLHRGGNPDTDYGGEWQVPNAPSPDIGETPVDERLHDEQLILPDAPGAIPAHVREALENAKPLPRPTQATPEETGGDTYGGEGRSPAAAEGMRDEDRRFIERKT